MTAPPPLNVPLYAVILAGGKGERFWPLSTSHRPKQFLTLFGNRSLLAQAVDRLDGLVPPERIFVVTNAAFLTTAREAAPMLPQDHIIGEPVGRYTAPAIALACARVQAECPEAVFAVLTADHVIGGLDRFRATLREGARLASEQNALVTIGIPPTFPSTGFGYIEAGKEVASRDGISFLKACRFVEKPAAPVAEGYVASGRFLWNAGMFIWSCQSLMENLSTHQPELAAWVKRLLPIVQYPEVLQPVLEREYPSLKKISIDYALMEKAQNIIVARAPFPWDDVGSWIALASHIPADENGNTVAGNAVLSEAAGNIVYAQSGRPVAMLGVKDMIVVEADGVTMICPKDRAADLKKLVEAARKSGRMGHLL